MSPRMVCRSALALILSFPVPDALAEDLICREQPVTELRQTCFENAVRAADNRLNDAYQERVASIKSENQPALADAQRKWIAFRDSACELEGIENTGARDAWIAALASDEKRAECVIRMSEARATELTNPVHPPATRPRGRSASVPQVVLAPALPESAYARRSVNAHRTGKFYFEATVNLGETDQRIEADLQLRIVGRALYAMTTYPIRPLNQVIPLEGGSVTIVGNFGELRLPRTVVGVAIDLESGQLTRHVNGDWSTDLPAYGSRRAAPDEYFFAEVYTSVAMQPLIDDQVLTVNFGDEPFVYPLPAGYAPFDGEGSKGKSLAALESVPVLLPGEAVAEQPLLYWVQRYWQWVRSFPRDESPSQDDVGSRCGAGQTSPVFFLTGSVATSPVRRSCVIPKDTFVFVPVINTLAQAATAAPTRCEELVRALNTVADSATELNFSINGQAMPEVASYRADSGCFELRDEAKKMSGLAVTSGYWIVLKPLPVGEYQLRFAGKYADGFSQDVRYDVTVE